MTEVGVDEGGNITLPCVDTGDGVIAREEQVYWVHEHRTIHSSVLKNNSLFLQQVKREDAGIYKCASSDYDEVLKLNKLIVRSEFKFNLLEYCNNVY